MGNLTGKEAFAAQNLGLALRHLEKGNLPQAEFHAEEAYKALWEANHPPASADCERHWYSSRTCQRGTQSCTVNHP